MTIDSNTFRGEVTFYDPHWEMSLMRLRELKSIRELNVEYTPDGIRLVRARVEWQGTPPEAVLNAPCFTIGFPQQFVTMQKVGEVFSLTVAAGQTSYEVRLTYKESPSTSFYHLRASDAAVGYRASFTAGRGSAIGSRLPLKSDLAPIPEEDY